MNFKLTNENTADNILLVGKGKEEPREYQNLPKHNVRLRSVLC